MARGVTKTRWTPSVTPLAPEAMPQEAHIDEKDAFVRQEEEQFVPARIAPVIEGMTPNQILAAYKAALNEHKLSNRASIRIYLKAVLWITSLAFVSGDRKRDLIRPGCVPRAIRQQLDQLVPSFPSLPASVWNTRAWKERTVPTSPMGADAALWVHPITPN